MNTKKYNNMVKLFENDLCSYIVACVLVVGGVILFAAVYQVIEKTVAKRLLPRKATT